MCFSRFNISFINVISVSRAFWLLVHKLASPKCVVAGMYVFSNIYFIIRIAKRKRRISLILQPVTTAEICPSRNLAEKTDKKWKFQILVSTCSWAAAQAGSTNCKIAVIVECDTFTNPTLENTHSFIKRIAKRKKRISLIPPPVTTAEIRPSRNFAEKMTKNENFKFWSQRVPERQHRQGLPTARSQFV